MYCVRCSIHHASGGGVIPTSSNTSVLGSTLSISSFSASGVSQSAFSSPPVSSDVGCSGTHAAER